MARVIVGIDGSPFAAHALAWAMRRREHVGDEVVAVFAWNVFNQGYHEPGEKLAPDFGTPQAEVMLDEALAEAGVSGELTRRVVNGAAPEGLVGEAGPDDLLVVGARGLGGFKGLLLGSVSSQVLQLAPCPVVVIRETDRVDERGVIVVGIDGSEGSDQALAWAASEARATGIPVRLVAAWQTPLYPTMAVPQVLEALQLGAQEQVDRIAASPVLEGVEVTTDVVSGSAAQALLYQDDAALIVVGTRGRGAVAGIVLGSVSRQVAHHADVPVVVV